METRPGRHLGDFELIRELGSGGMGTVWEAEQTSLGRRVALKILAPHISMSPTSLQRFQREAEAGARLTHPNIVAVHSVGEADGTHYIAQELVEGGGHYCRSD
jgi:serine/threonine protein kinase